MVTSGTTAFNMTLDEVFEEAYERAGLEMRSGYEAKTARRSLDIMMTEWANRGINLWTVEERTLSLQTGVATYTLGTDIIDLIEHVIRIPNNSGTINQTDYMISRTSVSTWSTRTNKNNRSRPTEIYIDRQREAPQITLWPVPPEDDFQLIYWVLRRIQDAGDYANNVDLPFRFFEPLVAGLASKIANKNPRQVAAAERDRLERTYENQFKIASEEDREKADLRLVPHNSWSY